MSLHLFMSKKASPHHSKDLKTACKKFNVYKKCCIGVRIDWLLKGANQVQIHDQNSSQSLIFKAFHLSVGRVPWQMNSILIIGIIAPYMYSFLRFFSIDAKVQTGCKITAQAPSKPVSTRFPTFSRWSAPSDE